MSQDCSLRSSPYEHIRQWCNSLEWGKYSLVVEVKGKQDSDPIFLELKGAVHNQRVEVFSQGGDRVLCYKGRLCVPDMGELRKHILAEAHKYRYSFQLGASNMYRNLQGVYLRTGMERDIADFMSKCPNCQQVKENIKRQEV